MATIPGVAACGESLFMMFIILEPPRSVGNEICHVTQWDNRTVCRRQRLKWLANTSLVPYLTTFRPESHGHHSRISCLRGTLCGTLLNQQSVLLILHSVASTPHPLPATVHHVGHPSLRMASPCRQCGTCWRMQMHRLVRTSVVSTLREKLSTSNESWPF